MIIGLPGIEPGLHPPHGRVLPVYYSPLFLFTEQSGRRDSNPESPAPKAGMLAVTLRPVCRDDSTIFYCACLPIC